MSYKATEKSLNCFRTMSNLSDICDEHVFPSKLIASTVGTLIYDGFQ